MGAQRCQQRAGNDLGEALGAVLCHRLLPPPASPPPGPSPQVDKDTQDMLRSLGLASLPGVTLQAAVGGQRREFVPRK